jgi:hypothetical protein
MTSAGMPEHAMEGNIYTRCCDSRTYDGRLVCVPAAGMREHVMRGQSVQYTSCWDAKTCDGRAICTPAAGMLKHVMGGQSVHPLLEC